MKLLAGKGDLAVRENNMKALGVIVILVLLGSTVWFVHTRIRPVPVIVSETIEEASEQLEEIAEDVQPITTDDSNEVKDIDNKKFTSAFFAKISDTVVYDHVASTNTPPDITGDAEIDAYIRGKATARGYKLRHQADESRLVSLQGQRLQPEASDALQALQLQAKQNDLNITFVSGYRSIQKQRDIVIAKLGVYDKEKLLAGELDAKINDILEVSSIPGYSKHHTGYTVDLACNSYDLSNAFMNTPCYKWLAAENFAHARVHNFIPSYPEVTAQQGPDPESWEFIWVPDSYLE